MAKSNDYVRQVAETIVAQLERGTAPWQKPWSPGERFMPFNPTSGSEYRGMNAMWLMAVAHREGHGDPRWMTYKQAQAADAQVRKGEKGTVVQYWKWQNEETVRGADGAPVLGSDGTRKALTRLERPQVFSAVVFNAAQIDRLPPLSDRPALPDWERHERAEAILGNSGVAIRHMAGDAAYYSPGADRITLPEPGQFASADLYYETALHELGHATGHPSRLNRDLAHPFGSEGYAREELRAEIASLMIGEQLEIGHNPQRHASYVGSWIKALQDDPREIFRAASDAEKIMRFMRELEQRQDISEVVAEVRAPVLMPASEPAHERAPYAETRAFGLDADPRQEFAIAIREMGLELDGLPVMDGERHRVRVAGDKPGETSGSYKGFADGRPSGTIDNWRTGERRNWTAQTPMATLSAGEHARLRAEAAQRRLERERHEQKAHEAAVGAIAERIARAAPAPADHPYLACKGVGSHGVYLEANGRLLIPVRTPDGELMGAQTIGPDGEKRFVRGSRVEGGIHMIGPSPAAGDMVVIAEGYATAATLHEATGLPVAAAFNAGNLKPAAEGLRKRYPDQKIVVAGDNDHHREREFDARTGLPKKNVGRDKAEQAAVAVGGYALIPRFDAGDPGTDWNDLGGAKGEAEVRKQAQEGLEVLERQRLARAPGEERLHEEQREQKEQAVPQSEDVEKLEKTNKRAPKGRKR